MSGPYGDGPSTFYSPDGLVGARTFDNRDSRAIEEETLVDKSADAEYKAAIMNEGYKKLKMTANSSDTADAPKLSNPLTFMDDVLDES